MLLKRTTAILLAAATMLTMGLTACGDSSSSESGSSAADSQSDAPAKSAAVAADELKNGVEFKDSLNEADEAIVQKLYKLTKDDYKEAKVYIGSGGATAEEIACFEANDADGVSKLEDAVKARIEDLKNTFKDYVPEEMDKLNDPVVVTKGNCVYMCLSNDNAKAKEIIG
ncbi:MAG: DUF4358 domain-containing protein [Ruminococcus sp.]|nr:DUF4358 domain-containing protein [Ruminococcus sp.]